MGFPAVAVGPDLRLRIGQVMVPLPGEASLIEIARRAKSKTAVIVGHAGVQKSLTMTHFA